MNPRKKFSLIVMLMAITLLTAVVVTALSAESIGGEYVFQADDQPGKPAEKYYDSPTAYPTIIEATNTRTVENSEYTSVAEPTPILTEQKSVVFPVEETPETLLTETPPQESVMPEKTVVPDGPSAEQLELLAGLEAKGIPPELHNEVWLNSEPLKLADLRGKVVLVEFWTYG